jgi:SseB protein C-terminal domain
MAYLPPGTQIFIGPPAKPMPVEHVQQIGEVLSRLPGITEAYLPQIYSQGRFDPPAQVLIVVLEENAPSPIQQTGAALRRILPEGQYLDVVHWPADHPFMTMVRQTGCLVRLNRKPN